jgi:hypothetical protein
MINLNAGLLVKSLATFSNKNKKDTLEFTLYLII